MEKQNCNAMAFQTRFQNLSSEKKLFQEGRTNFGDLGLGAYQYLRENIKHLKINRARSRKTLRKTHLKINRKVCARSMHKVPWSALDELRTILGRPSGDPRTTLGRPSDDPRTTLGQPRKTPNDRERPRTTPNDPERPRAPRCPPHGFGTVTV